MVEDVRPGMNLRYCRWSWTVRPAGDFLLFVLGVLPGQIAVRQEYPARWLLAILRNVSSIVI